MQAIKPSVAKENKDELSTSADSLIMKQLKAKGIIFSNDNSVALLTSGQEKFDDLFLAIEKAKESIHME